MTAKQTVLISKGFSFIRNVLSRIPFVQVIDNKTIKNYQGIDYIFYDCLHDNNIKDHILPLKGLVIRGKIIQSISEFDIECCYPCTNGEYITFLRRKNAQPLYYDVSFIVQGTDTDHTFITLGVVFLYGYLIASTWNIYNDLKSIEQHIITKNLYNNQNIFFHIQSVLRGLKQVRTSKVIKLRSDEIYLNLHPIVTAMYEYPHKFITTNIFIRKQTTHPFHCSDHIIAGSTDNMLKMFLGGELLIHNREPFKVPKMFKEKLWVPEQILTIGYLINIYPLYHLTIETCPMIMNNHFFSVGLHDLMPIQISYTKYWYDQNQKQHSEKIIVHPGNLHVHQNSICDMLSYKQLLT